MTVRPIDMQVVIAQQSNQAGVEQTQLNQASQVQAQELQKIPDKTHERETQVSPGGESNTIHVKEKEADRKKQGSGEKKQGEQQEGTEEEAHAKGQEDGKGVRFDVTT